MLQRVSLSELDMPYSHNPGKPLGMCYIDQCRNFGSPEDNERHLPTAAKNLPSLMICNGAPL